MERFLIVKGSNIANKSHNRIQWLVAEARQTATEAKHVIFISL